MEQLPAVLRELVWSYAPTVERRYRATGDLGWVLLCPRKFDLAFLLRLARFVPREAILAKAAATGRLDIVRAIRGVDWSHMCRAVRCASKRGHLHVIQHFATLQPVQCQILYAAIEPAVKHERFDILSWLWVFVGSLKDFVHPCCTLARPQVLSWLAQRADDCSVVRCALSTCGAVRVSQWILDRYFMHPEWYGQYTNLIAVTCAHRDDRFLRATNTWDLGLAANCAMLTAILQHGEWDERRWIAQSEVAMEVNDAALFAMCKHKSRNLLRAVQLGNWDIVGGPNALRLYGKKIAIFARLQSAPIQNHIVIRTKGNVDVWSWVVQSLPTIDPLSPALQRQMQFMLGDPVAPVDDSVRRVAARFGADAAQVSRAHHACSAFAETDNVFWFAATVAAFPNAMQFRSYLVLLCAVFSAYNCLAWLKDNGFADNLPAVHHVFFEGRMRKRLSARALRAAVRNALRTAPAHVRAKFESPRWPRLRKLLARLAK